MENDDDWYKRCPNYATCSVGMEMSVCLPESKFPRLIGCGVKYGGACRADFGPWGAWRAVGREVSWRAEVISEMAREYDTNRLNLGALFVSLGMYIEIRIYLDASGWSPW